MIAAGLVECFTARFDPSVAPGDGGETAATAVSASIEQVSGLDEDRIEDAPAHLEEWLVGADRTNLRDHTRAVAERGAPEDLVQDVELALDRFGLLDVVEIAELAECDTAVAGELYFHLCERVGLVPLLNGVSELPKEGRWDALARLALRDELRQRARPHPGRARAGAPVFHCWRRNTPSTALRSRSSGWSE
ncbi:hypothetical protein ABI214_16790 [Prescottella soli]|uniref:hypothetical protein n=1 Tax=Prescottella soli TaxID=1543852 RepID=UPI0032AFDF3A